MLGASKLLVRPAASNYLKLFYGNRLDELSALRTALGLKPRSRVAKFFDFFPQNEIFFESEKQSTNKLISSMPVISRPSNNAKTVKDIGATVHEGVLTLKTGRRAGLGPNALAYYEWSFLYNRLLPSELQYLTRVDKCGVCHSSFSHPGEARRHYLSEEHYSSAGAFLDQFFKDIPSEKPERLDYIDHTVWQQMYDRPLPTQLTDLCTRNKCDLCNEQFSDDVEMKRHYSRTQHRLSVRKYLTKLFPYSPDKMPQMLKLNYWYILWKGKMLPMELLVQCSPTHCHLCDEQFGDRKEAALHYTSDQHTCNTDQYLGKFFEGSIKDAPLKVERGEIQSWTSKFGELPPVILNKCTERRCELCQTDLPNFGVAKTHYEGRVHSDVVRTYLQNLRLEGIYGMERREKGQEGNMYKFKM